MHGSLVSVGTLGTSTSASAHLLDTNALSEPIKPQPSPRFVRKLRDAAAAEWHAIERARLPACGKVLPFADGQIAAIAKIQGLTVVTANRKDFEPFEGIETENWIE